MKQYTMTDFTVLKVNFSLLEVTCPIALQSAKVINCIRTEGYLATNPRNPRPSPVITKPAAAT